MSIVTKPKAIFFDWDDTLVDTWQVSFQALNTTRLKMGLTAWSDDEARKARGPSAKDLFTQLFGVDKWQDADRIYYQAYLDNIAENIALIPEAKELLDFLKARGIIMGIVSNKRSAILKKEVAHLGWDKSYFHNIIVGAGDAIADKPSAEPLLMALKQANVAKTDNTHNPDIWYVGDSWSDLACALNANVCAIHFGPHPIAPEKRKLFAPNLAFATHINFMEYIGAEFST